jgi:antitoxin (DNA-binding transcriptional repressor) of toxin-antitoxin stability system
MMSPNEPNVANVVILVEESELGEPLPTLLKAVEDGRWVEIRRKGLAVANIRPSKPGKGLAPMHPDLMGVKFNVDPTTPLTSDDWPEHLR